MPAITNPGIAVPTQIDPTSDQPRVQLATPHLHPTRTRHFNPAMARKPTVPPIPPKPTGRPKPKQAQADPKPPRPVEQFVRWDAFAGSEADNSGRP